MNLKEIKKQQKNEYKKRLKKQQKNILEDKKQKEKLKQKIIIITFSTLFILFILFKAAYSVISQWNLF